MFRAATFLTPVSLRRLGLVALACSALTLVGCGGGSRAKDYHPDSIVVFGDENSAFWSTEFVPNVAAGGNYSIHGLVYTVNPLGVGATYYCHDTTSTTRCDLTNASDLITDPVTQFLATDLTKPQGSGYHLAPVSGTEADNYNVVSLIALGSATVTPSSGTGSTVAMKRNFDVTYSCTSSSIAVQYLAHAFGLGFHSDCDKDAPGATTYAADTYAVSDVQAKISQNLSSLGSGVLVVVWAGQNDVLNVYSDTHTWVTMDAKRREIKYRADALASSVKQILNTGAKVVVIGVPDLGFSPRGRAMYASQGSSLPCGNNVRTDSSVISDCNGDLETLSSDFNNTLVLGDQALGLSGLQDYVYKGRQYAYVDAWNLTASYARNASYVNDRVCESDISAATDKNHMIKPDGTKSNISVAYCSTLSLVSGGSTSTYLWADDVHLAPVGHTAIGSQAYNQAANQF